MHDAREAATIQTHTRAQTQGAQPRLQGITMSLHDARLTEAPPPTASKPKPGRPHGSRAKRPTEPERRGVPSQHYLDHLKAKRGAARAARRAANEPPPTGTKQTHTNTKGPSRKGAAHSYTPFSFAEPEPLADQPKRRKPKTGRPKGRKDQRPRKRQMVDGQERFPPVRAAKVSKRLVTDRLLFSRVSEEDWLVIKRLSERQGYSPSIWAARALSQAVQQHSFEDAQNGLGFGPFRRIRLAWHLACGNIPRKVRRSIAAWDRDLRAGKRGVR